MAKHIIFEGAELAGKSWIMSQVYNYLEPKYHTSRRIMDGCHWFNCDNGIFGSEYGQAVISGYCHIFKILKEKNIIVEKFHITDIVNSRLYESRELDYENVEKSLSDMDFKIVLITFKPDKELIKKRIKDRLDLYPHYKRILQEPEDYFKQQAEYIKEAERSGLPKLIIETDILPDDRTINKILKFI